MEAPQTQFDAERKAAFVLAYERSGEKKAAAAAVGVTRQTVYDHLRKDPEFARDVELARGRLLDKLMQTLRLVGVDGVEEKHYDREGNVTRVTRKIDVRALLAWIKRLERDKWGDKVAVDQKVQGRVEHEHSVKPAQLDRVARAKVRDLLESLPAPE